MCGFSPQALEELHTERAPHIRLNPVFTLSKNFELQIRDSPSSRSRRRGELSGDGPTSEALHMSSPSMVRTPQRTLSVESLAHPYTLALQTLLFCYANVAPPRYHAQTFAKILQNISRLIVTASSRSRLRPADINRMN